jgi:hypothetical protein
MILLSIMVSRFLLVSGAVGIAPINSHSNCTYCCYLHHAYIGGIEPPQVGYYLFLLPQAFGYAI